MVKKSKNPAPSKPSKGKEAAKAGLGALIVGALVWLTGGVSKENGIEWLKSIGIAVTLALLIRWPIGEPFRIPSGSMEPTLHGDARIGHGDRVWVNKYVYGVRFPLNHAKIPFTNYKIEYTDRRLWKGAEPKRFDIIVFKAVEEEAAHNTLVKRVIGLPGERVHIANGKVYINSEPLELPDSMPEVEYTAPNSPFSEMKYGILEEDKYAVVPEGHYLFLGDNSARSKDGRFWGWVPNERILGRVASIWWPPQRWRDFTGFSKTWWWRTLLATLAVLFVVRLFFGRSWRVLPKEGEKHGEHLYINRWTLGPPIPFTGKRLYEGRQLRRGEVALYVSPSNEPQYEGLRIGRVAGVPGDKVFLNEGKLEVNGSPVTESAALAEGVFIEGEEIGPFGRTKSKPYSDVPPGNYFIVYDALSDNPLDSRTLGWIPQENLIGVATATWWPISKWRRIK